MSVEQKLIIIMQKEITRHLGPSDSQMYLQKNKRNDKKKWQNILRVNSFDSFLQRLFSLTRRRLTDSGTRQSSAQSLTESKGEKAHSSAI